MINWNYRIVKYKDDAGYGLHEVHYHDDGSPQSMTLGPITFAGDTPEEVREQLRMARVDAIKRPVFDETNLPTAAAEREG